MRQDGFELLRALGPGKKEPLDFIAPELPAKRELPFGFHPLGHHTLAQTVAESNNGSHEGIVFRVDADAADKRTVDLDLSDRQLLQVRERAVADAEIVDRERDAKAGEIVQAAHFALVQGLDEDALGDLEFQLIRLEIRLVQGSFDGPSEVILPELSR